MGSGAGPLAMATRSTEDRCRGSGIRYRVSGLARRGLRWARRADAGTGSDRAVRRSASDPRSPIPDPCHLALAAAGGARFGRFEIKPDERLVPVGCTRCRASTSGLSTWWSSTALQGTLVLRGASRLDAFSGYPVRTWPPGGAAGATTGPPEVRPSRSSRTRDSASQGSDTRGR